MFFAHDTGQYKHRHSLPDAHQYDDYDVVFCNDVNCDALFVSRMGEWGYEYEWRRVSPRKVARWVKKGKARYGSPEE